MSDEPKYFKEKSQGHGHPSFSIGANGAKRAIAESSSCRAKVSPKDSCESKYFHAKLVQIRPIECRRFWFEIERRNGNERGRRRIEQDDVEKNCDCELDFGDESCQWWRFTQFDANGLTVQKKRKETILTEIVCSGYCITVWIMKKRLDYHKEFVKSCRVTCLRKKKKEANAKRKSGKAIKTNCV